MKRRNSRLAAAFVVALCVIAAAVTAGALTKGSGVGSSLGAIFGATDQAGHRYGPQTDQVRDAVVGIDQAIGRLIAYLKQRDPNHPAYTNLMPNWARPEHTGLPTYEQYVDRFMSTVKPAILCYDHYSFFKHSDRAGWFANLELMRDRALKAKVPFWQIVQATSHGDYRRVTEAEKRWEAMHTLAYGGKAVLFFTYWKPDSDPIWDEPIIELDGTPTRQYEEIKRVNRDVQAIGKHLLHATSIGVMQQGRPGDQTNTLEDLPVDFDGPDITAGLFADGDARMMLLVNRDYRNAVDTPVRLKTNGKPLTKLDRATDKWMPVDRTEVRLQLAPGDGELYRW